MSGRLCWLAVSQYQEAAKSTGATLGLALSGECEAHQGGLGVSLKAVLVERGSLFVVLDDRVGGLDQDTNMFRRKCVEVCVIRVHDYKSLSAAASFPSFTRRGSRAWSLIII